MKMRVGSLLATSLLIIGGTTIQAQAATHEAIMSEPTEKSIVAPAPSWQHVSAISVGLQFNNGRGTLSASVIGLTGTTNINGSIVLEQLNANGTYTHVTSWNNLRASGNIFLWGTDFYVARGYTYRMTVTATVVRNGTSETISQSNTAYAN